MTNTEWNPRRAGEYARYSVWGEDVHPHHTFEEEEEEDEEMEEEDSLSFYEEMLAEEILAEEMLVEEMLADSFIHDVSLAVDSMKLSVSTPRLTIADGVSITFNLSDKATLKQEVIDGQLSLTIQENAELQSIKIHANNRTWTIPLNTLPMLPPSMPKKR